MCPVAITDATSMKRKPKYTVFRDRRGVPDEVLIEKMRTEGALWSITELAALAGTKPVTIRDRLSAYTVPYKVEFDLVDDAGNPVFVKDDEGNDTEMIEKDHVMAPVLLVRFVKDESIIPNVYDGETLEDYLEEKGLTDQSEEELYKAKILIKEAFYCFVNVDPLAAKDHLDDEGYRTAMRAIFSEDVELSPAKVVKPNASKKKKK